MLHASGCSLGSTRFLKVAKVTTEDGKTLVVKVFVIQDPSLSLKEHAHQVDSKFYWFRCYFY